MLCAACLAEFRRSGNLDQVRKNILEVVKTNLGGYQGINEDEAEKFEAEIDRHIFKSTDDLERFIRAFVEPQLAQGSRGHTNSSWLGYKDQFAPFRADLSIDWLKRFPILPLHTLDTLFDLAAQYADRGELKELVAQRCAEFLGFWPERTEDKELEDRRTFWFLRSFYFLDVAPTLYWDWLKADKETILALNARSGPMNRGENSSWPNLSARKVEAILDAFIDKWPKVDLPSSHGSESPDGEDAYRFLSEVVWAISLDRSNSALTVLDSLLSDPRFADFDQNLRSIRSTLVRKKALEDFIAPTPQDVAAILDRGEVTTVEVMREAVLQELRDYQADILGGEFNTAKVFYEKGKRKGEVPSALIVAERLRLRLEPKGITIAAEHQLKNANRADITATKVLNGKRKLLVTEVKGQWHIELLTAAKSQLAELYSIHPDAEQQGIYLILWFGKNAQVAGRKNVAVNSADELKVLVEGSVPTELKGLIEVFVLDLSDD